MKSPKQVVEEIYYKNWYMSHPDQAHNQEAMLNIISEGIYPDPHRFLLELFQNFDDSSLSTNLLDLTFTICDNFIIASHQGRPFDEQDVNSICSSGNSTKMKDSQSTGNKGIGFKSVFMHSNKVIIISNGYCFRFDKEHFDDPDNCWQDDWGKFNVNYKEIKKPWQLIPLWTEENKLDNRITSITKNFKNNFVFQFHSCKILNTCKNFIYEVLDDPFYFLFLKCHNLKIKIVENGKEKILLRSDLNGISRITVDNKEPYYFYIKSYNVSLEVEDKLTPQGPTDFEIFIEDSYAPKKFKELKILNFSFGVQLEREENDAYRIIPINNKKTLVYSLLPTCQNFYFPFLTNANFYLDASRTQIKDDPWNIKIFSHLPEYIDKFVHEDLFVKFGNSYAECLIDPDKIKILNQNFSEVFNINFGQYRDKKILLKTKNGSIKEISKCILNLFKLQVDKKTYHEFIEIVKLIYEDNSHGEKIMKEYFNEKCLIYDDSHLIIPEDLVYANKLLKIYPTNENFYRITYDELLFFLESSTYKNNYRPIILKNILDLLNSSKKLNDSKLSNIKFIQDIKNEFKQPKELYILEAYNSVSEDINFIVDSSLKSSFNEINKTSLLTLSTEHKKMLETLGVNIIKASNYADNLISNLHTLYIKETSIQIIRTLFSYISHDGCRKEEVYKKLKQCKFLSEGDEFLCMYSLHIGRFYNKNSICRYLKSGISRKYYMDSTNFEDWIAFFRNIGIICDEEQISRDYLEEEFLESPFFSKDYKNLVVNSKIKFPVKMNVYPFLENLSHTEDLSEISTFFKKNWKSSTYKNKNVVPNFLEWFIVKERRLIPNKSLNLKKAEEIYSEDIIKSETRLFEKYENKNKIVSLLEENLNFPSEKLKGKILDEIIFNTKLRKEDRILILEKIINKNFTRNHDEILKEYYLKLFTELGIFHPDYKYFGYILNEDLEFKSPQDLYYMDIDQMDFLLKVSLGKKYSQLWIPNYSLIFSNAEDFDKSKSEQNRMQEYHKKFLDFCLQSGVKIFRKKNLHKAISDQKQNNTIPDHFKKQKMIK
jgi:hypothetical protein